MRIFTLLDAPLIDFESSADDILLHPHASLFLVLDVLDVPEDTLTGPGSCPGGEPRADAQIAKLVRAQACDVVAPTVLLHKDSAPLAFLPPFLDRSYS